MSTGGNFADATGGGLFRIRVKIVISTARAPTAPSAMPPERPGSARIADSQARPRGTGLSETQAGASTMSSASS